MDGIVEGKFVGVRVGTIVGDVGITVGVAVVGFNEGNALGIFVGLLEGIVVGITVGDVGIFVGTTVGIEPTTPQNVVAVDFVPDIITALIVNAFPGERSLTLTLTW